MASALPSRIDVHSHFLPPFYSAALASNGHSNPDGMPAIPAWSTQAHLEMMTLCNVSKSILSISSPGTHLVPGKHDLARDLTRQCNAYAADLKNSHPDKFGFWASLPLPDVDDALKEVERAVEEGCDGFGLLTNYHGEYIGSSAFDAVFEKLNKIGATVFIHPTRPCVKCQGETATVAATPFGEHYPIPMFEFFFDTARAVINLFSSGTVEMCPNITFIVPHSGGCLPPLFSRFTGFSHVVPGGKRLEPDDIRRQIREQFYFDLAGFVFDGQTGGNGQLKAFVHGYDISYQTLLYGSDFPFTPAQFVNRFADRMKDGLENLFDVTEREGIYEKNAIKLLEDGRRKRGSV
jgi:predicted TIM-barrel fold metal-dependent hydrolase